jgi:UDP-glucose 4-epimerase
MIPLFRTRRPANGNFKSFLRFCNVASSHNHEQELQAEIAQLFHLYANHAFTNQSHSNVVGTCHQLGQGHCIVQFITHFDVLVSHHK